MGSDNMSSMRDLGVLVVDDDRGVVSVIERMFSHFKVRVDCAISAKAALLCLKEKNYRTMVVNLGIQDMDALKLAQKARKVTPELNIVLFTGDTPEQVLRLVLEPKVSDLTGAHLKPSGLGDMLMDIMKRETGRTFLLA